MIFRVLLTETAGGQIEKIADWWEVNRRAGRGLFLDELESQLVLLSSNPFGGAEYSKAGLPGVRRRLLPKTRYHVYYTVDEAAQIILVRAVWHAMRGSGPRL